MGKALVLHTRDHRFKSDMLHKKCDSRLEVDGTRLPPWLDKVHIVGSNPTYRSKWKISSVGLEYLLNTQKVIGSNPISSTKCSHGVMVAHHLYMVIAVVRVHLGIHMQH